MGIALVIGILYDFIKSIPELIVTLGVILLIILTIVLIEKLGK